MASMITGNLQNVEITGATVYQRRVSGTRGTDVFEVWFEYSLCCCGKGNLCVLPALHGALQCKAF